jgi:thioredoxin 1
MSRFPGYHPRPVEELDETTFDDAVGVGPILVDFWAPWCKPCLAIEPSLERLSERVPVARLNIDEYPEIASRYSVLAIPTVIAFERGEVRGEVRGARPLAHYERWLAEVLPTGKLEPLAVQQQLDA